MNEVTLGKRIFAFIIDIIVINTVSNILARGILAVLTSTNEFFRYFNDVEFDEFMDAILDVNMSLESIINLYLVDFLIYSIPTLVSVLIITLLYSLLLPIVFKRGTIGLMGMHLKVVRTNSQKTGPVQYFLRLFIPYFIFSMIPIVIILLNGITYLVCHKTFSDIISLTSLTSDNLNNRNNDNDDTIIDVRVEDSSNDYNNEDSSNDYNNEKDDSDDYMVF